ncbi:MAG: iron uptake porin [Gloeotrichia echinulata DVL01]|jgi:hypothetical protein|nr:iron uptake porin [Gloeotrichia echinulata DEX184]
MPKVLWNYLLVIPTFFSGVLVLSTVANAAEIQPTTESEQSVKSLILESAPITVAQKIQPESTPAAPTAVVANDSIGQVTSVSQLSDVKPTDWAFQALQSLVERYGVITGLPNGTFQGNRALTRYEFAAGLNAALDRLNELIATTTEDSVSRTDFATLQKLQEYFADELTAIRGRVDKLEARTAKLESNQFSTTTRLQGDAIFILGDTFGKKVGSRKDETNAFTGYRVRLALQTSFTGKDQLTTSLTGSNIPVLNPTITGTHQTRFAVEGSAPLYSDGSVFLDRLYYRFPVGKKLNVWVGARALQPAVFTPTLNPLVGGLNGATSRFSSFNHTVYRPGFDGAGAAVAYKFNNQLQFNAGYIADNNFANSPAAGNGLFSGNHLALGQLTFSPNRQLDVGLTYTRKYFGANNPLNVTGGTGTAKAFQPFEKNATSSDNFGLQFNWKASSAVHVGGWFGYTLAHQESGGKNDATIINTAVTLAFPDLFQKGNLGGLVIGIPPKVTSNNYTIAGVRREDKDTSLHLEAFYTFKLNDNISVTPDLFVVTNPEGNSANNAVWVGSVRTTFTF